MENSGVTFRMANSSTLVKYNNKLCNYCAIDMLLFSFSIGTGMEVTGPKPFLWEKVRAQKGLYLILLQKTKKGKISYNQKI